MSMLTKKQKDDINCEGFLEIDNVMYVSGTMKVILMIGLDKAEKLTKRLIKNRPTEDRPALVDELNLIKKIRLFEKDNDVRFGIDHNDKPTIIYYGD